MPLMPDARVAAEMRLAEVRTALLEMAQSRAFNLKLEEELHAERKRLEELLG